MPVYKKINNELIPFFYNQQFVTDWDFTQTISTLPYYFQNGSIVVYNNEIHILGGSDNLTKHYKYNGANWVSVSELPYNFEEGCAIIYNNEIHILGGYRNLTKHYKYNGTNWEEESELPYNFRDGAAIVYNNELHILGGGSYEEGGLYLHYYWDDKNEGVKTWKRLEDLPTDVTEAVVYNNQIHLFGYKEAGYSGDYCYYVWDPIDSNWNFISNNYPYNTSRPSIIVIDNQIHMLGGGTSEDSGDYRHYAWDGIKWTELSILPQDGIGNIIVYNNEIHTFSGQKHYQIGKHLATNFIDNIDWSYNKSISTLPYDFSLGAAITYNNEIHIFGGYYSYNDKGNLKKHYKYNGTNWVSVSELPYEFLNSSIIIYNNEIHILGSSTTEDSKKHYKYNGSNWVPVSELPYEFNGSDGAVVIYNNEMHIFGGSSDNYASHYKYNESNWEELSEIPGYSYDYAGVVYNNKVYLFDRDSKSYMIWNGEEWSGSISFYDFHSFSENCKIIVFDNKIHIFNDISSNESSYYLPHLVFNGGSKWEGKISLPYPLENGSVVVYNDEIHILGGNKNSRDSLKHYQVGKYREKIQNGEGVTAKKINNQLIGFSEGAGRSIAKKINGELISIIKDNKIIIEKPSITINEYTYNGAMQGPTIINLDINNTIVTNATGIDANTYTLTIKLKDKAKMTWDDLTTEDLVYEYTISPKKVSVPTVTGSYTYDGTEKSAIISNYNSNEIIQGGIASAINSGTYIVTFDLANTNYIWSDSTITQKTGTWGIN